MGAERLLGAPSGEAGFTSLNSYPMIPHKAAALLLIGFPRSTRASCWIVAATHVHRCFIVGGAIRALEAEGSSWNKMRGSR